MEEDMLSCLNARHRG